MSTLANTPAHSAPGAFVDPRFVDVQAHAYWAPKYTKGWRVRITSDTVFSMPPASFVVMERLVAFYLVDYGPDSMPVSEEFSDVLFTMTIRDFLYMYGPVGAPT